MTNVTKKVFLFPSEIAAFIGQNPYDFVTPFERLWKRCDTECYNNIINDNKEMLFKNQVELQQLDQKQQILEKELQDKNITKRQYTIRFNKIQSEINQLKQKGDRIERDIDNIDLNQEQRLKKNIGETNVELVLSDKVNTETKRENIIGLINNMDISKDKKNILLKETTNLINKTHGTLKEESAIEMFQKRFNVKLDTSQQFFKKEILKQYEFDWYIGGRLDGIYTDEENPKKSYIVEIKNRTRGFFNSLRDYERTQVQTYMHLLPIETTKLVEKYNNQLRITVVYKDQDYINSILEYLETFITSFCTGFLNNDSLKRKFVSSDNLEKQTILKQLYLNKINDMVNKKLESTLEHNDSCELNDELNSDNSL